MSNPTEPSQEEFTPTREHEFQDAHYHDEEPEVANDEANDGWVSHTPKTKTKRRIPPPRRRHYEE